MSEKPSQKIHSPSEASEPTPQGRRGGLRFRGLGGFWEKAGALALPKERMGEGFGAFVSKYRVALGFCFAFLFASSLGQTFLLSVFQPFWMERLGIGAGAMGMVYGLATLASGLLLPFAGRWIDRTAPGTAATAILLGLVAASLLASAVTAVWMLGLALFLLRFFGQGLCTNLSMTNASRWFTRNRGKALSVASLGFPVGEAVFPLALVGIIAFAGWRGAWWILAAGCLLAILPLVHALLLRAEGEDGPVRLSKPSPNADGESWIRLYADWTFWGVITLMAPLAFVGTGVIFFQTLLAAERGWGPEVFASGFVAFAVVRALVSLSAGAWVDRVGALRLTGAPNLVFAAALGILILPHPFFAYLFFVVLGLSFGASTAVISALWPELFGTDRIGTIRGASAAVGVVLSAASPVIYGYALDRGATMETILMISAIAIVVICWPVSIILRVRLGKRA